LKNNRARTYQEVYHQKKMEVDWPHSEEVAQLHTRQAFDWNPQGNRKRGRPKTTWRRTVEKDLERRGMSWREAEALAGHSVN
jgi:hypothetical protein